AINLQRNATAKASTPPSTLEMAMVLQGVSAADQAVISDDQYVAALANRKLPPELVDTSMMRITSGYLTAAQLQDVIIHNRIRVILFASGRFDHLPEFRAWVALRYTQIATFDGGAALFWRQTPLDDSPSTRTQVR